MYVRLRLFRGDIFPKQLRLRQHLIRLHIWSDLFRFLYFLPFKIYLNVSLIRFCFSISNYRSSYIICLHTYARARAILVAFQAFHFFLSFTEAIFVHSYFRHFLIFVKFILEIYYKNITYNFFMAFFRDFFISVCCFRKKYSAIFLQHFLLITNLILKLPSAS